ncbi:FtsW/RodA/SpoVE family cell cycle protein [Mucilaginibacter pocheonensis]|uniref:Cell division protein FtsW (Lipid II flippase) n=1 Tax=Mucilaginibacter pocheonensis TaxID=398050 RepID=A0ABU1THP3_9SPHI|nr:FtsW/RodA/SpoVE family cell cycle protein [Mucilaginibacter pocheonensis]MDR6944834.1 cell division protein FtsW (lipid II flippase) [Mucilaginibacter pocheonensis]
MDQGTPKPQGRRMERLFLLLTGIVLAVLFGKLYFVLQQKFVDVDKRLKDGTIVNLNAPNTARNVAALLQKGYYFDDPKDVDYIRTAIAAKANTGEGFDNAGEINKHKYYVVADDAFANGGESFKKRVMVSRSLLGYTGDDSVRFTQERNHPPQIPVQTDLGLGEYSIRGTIKHKELPVAGVLVRLTMILPQDSIYTDEEIASRAATTQATNAYKKVYVINADKKRQLQSLTAFARTDENGRYEFKNLPTGKAFEVLPLQPGFEFGTSQGVVELTGNKTLNFFQSPHTIKLLSTRDFNILKKEGAFIVRTQDEFNEWYWIIAGSFFAGFLIIHVLLSSKYPQADQLILPLVMLLTGISFLTLLSLQDPLRDRFLAKDTLIYLGIGVGGICIMQFFNLRRFNADSTLYRLLFFKGARSAANGWPWAILAMALLFSTILFGTGPEGSGVKVNLLGVQPSEIVKYLIVIFLAGFFAANERFISQYASWGKRWSFFSFALIATIITLLLFLVLGDLGPAMVICFTFIILFSFSRGDFLYMAAYVLLFVLSTWVFDNVWLSALVTFGIWGLVAFLKPRLLSESAFMALIVVTAFLTIDKIPGLDKIIPGPVERLVERKAIWQDAWNNEVYGGDQVANGLWAMASGGLSGTGIGQGFAKTIPEAHTDMILPSIGEEFGWTGMAAVFILFLLYLHRSIIIGRQTGTPLLFYLSAGIGTCTFVQFILIAGGSIGALPLSGVSLPFESYGGSSLVINMVAAGFLLSVSSVKGTAVQMSYITKQQDKNLVPALAAALAAVILLTTNVSRYSVDNIHWVVKPALVADKSGLRMFSYNPRISILMNKLQAGSLLDRNGLILATSKPELIQKQKEKLAATGLMHYDLDSAMHKRLERFYPFEEQTFFWTGDDNTGVFNGSTNGYFAEYEHAAELRGFRMPVTSYNVKASRYQEDRFLPRGVKEMTVNKRDYSALAPLLLADINGPEIAAFKNKNRDVQLTVDAELQASIQQSIAADTSLLDNRVSVVIMEAATGDVLTSAVYPLPPVRNWDQLTMSQTDQNKLGTWMTTTDLGFTYASQPGSTAKVLTAMSAFNKLGIGAADVVYHVSMNERIRTKGIEPDETGMITMERAIAKSNNVYFIKLANQQHLEEYMGNLYLKTGMFLHGVGGYYYNKPAENADQEEKWRKLWRKTEFNTKPRYDPNNIHKTRAKGISGMAWGQGELIATPAAVARLISGVANDGILKPNRFVLKINDTVMASKAGVKLADKPEYAALLKQYMITQSAPKVPILHIAVAGKSGTPERIVKNKSVNDGWYVFFAPEARGKGNMVVCIRIESTKGSSDAVKLAGNHVIPFLLKKGYMKSFAPEKEVAPPKAPPAEEINLPGDTALTEETNP